LSAIVLQSPPWSGTLPAPKSRYSGRMESVRIDKWLWAARFFKTRSLATEEVNKGHVQVGANKVKPARELRLGETVTVLQAQIARTIVVKGLSGQRGPAPVAQALYEETADSISARLAQQEQRRLRVEPASAIEHGRPTKRERRKLQAGLDARWSATLDD
jgi:ribosome-associated heat shock protein Hsp15